MRVLHLNYSSSGGAGRAAYRINNALLSNSIKSHMLVSVSLEEDKTITGPCNNSAKIITKGRMLMGKALAKALKTENAILHTPDFLPSRWPKTLNASNADLIHLHWLGGEMMSIGDIEKIRKPLVWTLHDMWAFCGAEHVSYDNRYQEGYTSHNRPAYEQGFDLNRWTWQRKQKHWQQPIQIVTPSRWLATCVQQSALMHNWPVTVVPNPIDTQQWQPVEKSIARQLLGLPPDCPLIAFGTSNDNDAPHKGFDLLKSALVHLKGEIPELELVIFGQNEPKRPPELGFPINYAGFLHDKIALRLLYSAINAIIIPSRVDNFPNIAIEAHACGTPIVAFATCGLPDIVDHKQSGYLAKAFDVEDLAWGIQWVLSDTEQYKKLSRYAREKAVRYFDYAVVAPQYQQVYHQVLNH